MQHPLYYDVPRASALLGPGFGQTAIKAAMRDGSLPYKRVSKRVSITYGDLVTLAESMRSAPIGPLDRARGAGGKFVKKPAAKKTALIERGYPFVE
jgi:hypothetical protein